MHHLKVVMAMPVGMRMRMRMRMMMMMFKRCESAIHRKPEEI